MEADGGLVAPSPIGGDPKSDPADSKSSSGVSDRRSEGLRKGNIFRGLPPRYLPDFASDHDTLMRDAISKTLGVDSMEPHVVKQVFSPQSGSAGLSFTESSKIAPIAYIHSIPSPLSLRHGPSPLRQPHLAIVRLIRCPLRWLVERLS